MDTKPTTSLQERINALNLDKIPQASPRKSDVSNARSSVTVLAGRGNLDKIPQASPRNPDVSNARSSVTVLAGRRTEVSNDRPEQTDSARDLVSQNNRPVTDIQANEPLERDSTQEVENPMDGPIYSTPNNIPAQSADAEPEETSYCATPRDLPIAPSSDADRTILPDDIKSKWSYFRRTITNTKLRAMVDMSELSKRKSDDVSDFPNEDVVLSPKRSQSLADCLSPINVAVSDLKRPSLPAMFEIPTISEDTPYEIESPSSGFLSPEHGTSRQSSFKSTGSGTLSNGSETEFFHSNDDRRSRNFSDVSITYEENNYLSFEPIDDGSELLSNERTLVLVRGDIAYTGKLTLAKEEEENSSPTYDDAPLELCLDATEEMESKKPKGKGIKALTGKLKKVIKNKKQHGSQPVGGISPTNGSPRSVPRSPEKFLAPNKASAYRTAPQSPAKARKHSTHSGSMMSSLEQGSICKRHQTHSSGMMTSPAHTRSIPQYAAPSPSNRPHSMFPEYQSNSATSRANEGLYFDPSRPYDGGDTLTAEVIEEQDGDDDACEDHFDYCDVNVIPLKAQERSQSVADLSHHYLEAPLVNTRKMSASVEELRQNHKVFGSEGLYMNASTHPIPPPKTKSTRRKLEKQCAESEYVTSQRNFPSKNELIARLRSKKHSVTDAERKNWPGGRPPSMPSQLPPNPPRRPSSMPADDPPVPEDANSDENEYVSPAQSNDNVVANNSLSDGVSPSHNAGEEYPITRLSYRPRSTHAWETNLSSEPTKDDTPSPTHVNSTRSRSLSEEDDTIYYTVDDPAYLPSAEENEEGCRKTPRSPNSTMADVRIGTHRQNPQGLLKDRVPEAADCMPTKIMEHSIRKPLIAAPPPTKLITNVQSRPSLLPRQSSTNMDTPEKHKPAKPNAALKPSVQPLGDKPVKLLKPITNYVSKSPPKLPPKPRSASITTSEIRAQEANATTERSQTGQANAVVPPPRPSKGKKFQVKPDDNPPVDSNSQSFQTPPRSPAIAELGKLISIGSPMSPRLPKSTLRNPNRVVASNGPRLNLEPVDKKESANSLATGADGTTASLKSLGTVKTPNIGSVTKISPTRLSQEKVSACDKPAIAVVKNTLQTTLANAASIKPASTSVRGRGREAPKRPTKAPPTRPTAPPPPRPDNNSLQQKVNPTCTPTRTPPPNRPPPLSMEKIKAAEKRRRYHGLQTESFESEYNDSAIRHGDDDDDDEDNPYADIDDDAIDAARRIAHVQHTTPIPPARPKHSMRRAVQGITAIANMKNLTKQNKKNAEKLSDRQEQIVMPKDIYNSFDYEEVVYAGIDDI